jgi:hypothetical protein
VTGAAVIACAFTWWLLPVARRQTLTRTRERPLPRRSGAA